MHRQSILEMNADPLLSRTVLRYGRFKKIEEICDIVRRKDFSSILGVTMCCCLELVNLIGHIGLDLVELVGCIGHGYDSLGRYTDSARSLS